MCMMNNTILGIREIRGTDVSYSFICDRRLWLSLHGDVISDGTEFIYEGKNLEGMRRKIGYSQVSIGRNKIDGLEIRGNVIILHEFKRGKKLILPDIMQTLHYMLLLKEQTSKEILGKVHLSSRKIFEIKIQDDLIKLLNEGYKKINELTYKSEIPKATKNGYCFSGCSFVEFCWGNP